MVKSADIFPHEDTESLNEFYGDPRGRNGKVSTQWFKDNIVKWVPPYQLYYSDISGQPLRSLLVHHLCLDTFQAAFTDVLNHFGQDRISELRLDICAGTYNYRPMRGGSRLSVHAYGIAIDIDPENNPFPHPWTEAGIDKDFVAILENHGFYWRGTNGDIDPMHFQCAYRGEKTYTKPIPPLKPRELHEEADIPSKIYSFFLANGFTPAQAAGVVANVEAESGFDLDNVGDGGLAHGLFQMHPDRREVIQEAVGVNMAHGSVEDQLKGALWELQHVELRAYRMIKAAETPFSAGYNMCRYYERPASHYEWIKRGRAAVKWYDKFTSLATSKPAREVLTETSNA